MKRKPNDNPWPVAIAAAIIACTLAAYPIIAWASFFYRQPHKSELDALMHPIHVLTFQRIEE